MSFFSESGIVRTMRVGSVTGGGVATSSSEGRSLQNTFLFLRGSPKALPNRDPFLSDSVLEAISLSNCEPESSNSDSEVSSKMSFLLASELIQARPQS